MTVSTESTLEQIQKTIDSLNQQLAILHDGKLEIKLLGVSTRKFNGDLTAPAFIRLEGIIYPL